MENPVGFYNLLVSKQTATSRYSSPVKMPHCRIKTLQVMGGVSSGTGAVTAKFYGSCKEKPVAFTSTTTGGDWTQIGSTITLAPDASTSTWISGAVTSTDGFLWVMVAITGLSGNDIQTSAWVAG